jgi:glutamyl-tRNA synthetase
MKVVTRFAPSPTGYLHIGGVRTALFSYAYAKKNKGDFLLRIEDTDIERSSVEAVNAILEGMKWLGLEHDKTIQYQTKRLDLYKKYINTMIKSGDAYHCYASKEELDNLRDDQIKKGDKPRYDGRWRPENGKALPKPPKGISPTVRFKNPKTGIVKWVDLVKGEINISNEELDDFIIARSDGTPTYNFCVVIDDWDMDVSHVIRGDDHINNTPRQINLLNSLKAPIPNYAHLSMIHGPDGQKLSKRHGSVNVMQYKEDGYLPESLNNYLARLGWSHGDDEKFSMESFCEWFNFEHVTSSSAQFDKTKLDWLNGEYIKEYDIDKLTEMAALKLNQTNCPTNNNEVIRNALNLYKDRETNLNTLFENIVYFFKKPDRDSEMESKYINEVSRKNIKALVDSLECIKWKEDDINQCIKDFVKNNGLKFPEIAMPLRVRLAGNLNTPNIGSIIFVLGFDELKERVNDCL